MSIEQKLKEIRGPLSQAALADLLGISQSLLAKWESTNPRDRLPTVAEVRAFCCACGATAEQELAAYHALAASDSGEARGLVDSIAFLKPEDQSAELQAWRSYGAVGPSRVAS